MKKTFHFNSSQFVLCTYTVPVQCESGPLSFSCLELFKSSHLVFFKLVANSQLKELFASPKIISMSTAYSSCRKKMAGLRAVRM